MYELKKILSAAIPISFATICRTIIMNTDIAFIGHIGTNQLSGASIANFIISLIFTPICALNSLLPSLVGSAIGSNNPKESGKWLKLAIFFNTISSVLLAIITIFSIKPLLNLLLKESEHKGEIIEYTELYAIIFCIAQIPLSWYQAIRLSFSGLEKNKPAVYVSFVSVIVNFGLNYLLIHYLHFIGAPLATLCCYLF